MPNDFYDPTGYPRTGENGNSATMRAELDLIESGFNKLPTLTGNGGKLVKVNAATDALETSGVISDNGTDATVSGDLTITGDINNTALDADLTALQADIDTRATSLALTAHINDSEDAHDASAISNAPSGNLSATNVQTALNELQTDINTRATSSALTEHTGAATGAHAATAISNTPTGNLIATTVQSALNELQEDIDSRATAAALSNHLSDEIDAHEALAIANEPSGNLEATTVQGALDEIQAEVDGLPTFTQLLDSAASSLIGFIQAGVDAVVRTVQDKLRETISVKDFGAVGDGVTDDTDAINAALVAGAGKSVFMPDKKYLISGSITVPIGTRLYGQGACDLFRVGDAGTTFYITHTGSPALIVKRGAKLDGINFYYPEQVLTGTPVAYDWTIKFDYTVSATDSSPMSGTGNNAGVNLENLVFHNTYKGIWLGGDVNASPATTYGAVYMDKIRMYAIHTGVYSGYTLSEVHVTDFVHSPLFWNASIGQDIRTWTYENGFAIWHYEATQGSQFNNCTFFGHNRGLYLAPQDGGTSTTEAYSNFLKATGCLFDGLRKCIEVTGNAGLGGAVFTGCIINAGQFADTAYNSCIGFHSNNSLNSNYVNFVSCLFLGTAGSHVVIENTLAAVFQRFQFVGCQFLNANRNNAAGTYYNIYVNDLFSSASRAFVQIVGCLFDNTNESSVTNIKVVSIRTLQIVSNVFIDTTAKIFDIAATTTRLILNDNTVESSTASTFPTTTKLSVASASTITLPDSNSKYIVVTGTTGVTNITASYPDRLVILKFNGSLTVTDGSNLKLNGNFVATGADTLTLVCDGTDWYEVARSTN